MTAKAGTDHVFRRLRIAGIVVALLLAAGLVALYALTDPPEKNKDTAGCTVVNCGPLAFMDCNAVLDGPLHVYTRFPRRYVEDCSFWRMGNTGCRTLVKVRNWCTP